MRPHTSLFLFYAALLGLCFAPASLTAMTSDRDKPLTATADHSEYSESHQRQTLTHNVVITQGTLKMTADKIIIHLKEDEVDTVDANGGPVTFEQFDDNGDKVSGKADTIEYSATSGQLVLSGDAELVSPRQSLNAQRIHYNVNSQAASAEGGNGQQVNIVIQPPESAQ